MNVFKLTVMMLVRSIQVFSLVQFHIILFSYICPLRPSLFTLAHGYLNAKLFIGFVVGESAKCLSICSSFRLNQTVASPYYTLKKLLALCTTNYGYLYLKVTMRYARWLERKSKVQLLQGPKLRYSISNQPIFFFQTSRF